MLLRRGPCFLASLYVPSQVSLVVGRAPARRQWTRRGWATRILRRRLDLRGAGHKARSSAFPRGSFGGRVNRDGAASEPEQFSEWSWVAAPSSMFGWVMIKPKMET